MRDPSRKEDAKNLGIVYGAGAVAALLTLALLLPGKPAPVYEVVVQPAPAPVPADAPEPEVEPVVAEVVHVPEPVQVSGDNRLYGRVTTNGGRSYEGYIRWDRNEGSWADLLDANKRLGHNTGVTVIQRRHRSRDAEQQLRREIEQVRRQARAQAEVAREQAEELRQQAAELRERLRGEERGAVVRFRSRTRDRDRDQDQDVDIDLDLDQKIAVNLSGISIALGQLNGFDGAWTTTTGSAKSGIRFGHVRSIAPLDSRSALFTLKSGEEMELWGSATDLGSSLRALVVEMTNGDVIELEWEDLDVVEFFPAPEDASPPSSRLYGTMTTHSGLEFTGYVTWDVDEIYTSDTLDGEDHGEDRSIPFGSIERIDRDSSMGAMVTLKGGEQVLLEGTNDVDQSNNGISVSDPALGQVKVSWFDFESVRFHEAESHAGYGQFDGGQKLYGTVETTDGETLTGELVWDCDEAYTWEMLNGEQDGVEFHVEFTQVASVAPVSRRASEVTLKDGRTFELSGSNDVNSDNKGIVVRLDNGKEHNLSWKDVREVRFHER